MATPRAPRAAPTWTFAARFRRGAFGWKSDRAIERLDEAAAELRAMVRKDPVLAANGAVRLIEKLSPAFENVDDSSGRLQAAIRDVFEQFVPLIGTVEVAAKTRKAWLERLWQAMADDEMPWIERLGDHWGTLCGSPEVASAWADELLPGLRDVWAPGAKGHGWYSGTIPCLSSLYAAGRHAELLVLLESPHTHDWWDCHRWGVKALLAHGHRHEALAMAERCYRQGRYRYEVARTCEAILIDLGQRELAYRQYAFEANQANTNLGTLKALAAKYPEKDKARILTDLVEANPGSEGKWFAAAKSAGLFDVALKLARSSPTDPRTLARAARDFATKQPAFALEAGLLALGWMARGYGYEVSARDVWMAWEACLAAGKAHGLRPEDIRDRALALCDGTSGAERFVRAEIRLPAGSD
jgi:hypothetical protein